MLDLKRTLTLVSGALFDRETTWKEFRPDAGNWQRTLLQLTLPLIIVSASAAFLMSSVFADGSIFSLFRPTLKSTMVGMLVSILFAGIVAAIIGTLSGVFGGKTSIALGLAATTLAFIPGYLAQVVTWLPWIGGLLSLALGVFSLVLLWKIIPLYLEVPDGKRAAHYFVSLAAIIVAGFLLSRAVAPNDYAEIADTPFARMAESALDVESTPGGQDPSLRDSAVRTPTSDFVSDAMTTSRIMRAAAEDKYTPPDDGRLSEQQVITYLAHVGAAGEEYRQKMENINAVSSDLQGDGDVSMADISQMMKAANAGGGIAVVEINAVKKAGGNWAEHQWVRQTLVTAGRMQNANPTTAHNYALFQKYDAAIMRGMTQD